MSITLDETINHMVVHNYIKGVTLVLLETRVDTLLKVSVTGNTAFRLVPVGAGTFLSLCGPSSRKLSLDLCPILPRSIRSGHGVVTSM